MRLLVPPDLIENALRGGSAEMETLLEALWPEAYRLARAVVREGSAAEDAAQEACVTIYRTIGTLRNVEAFGTWFYRIVTRAALRERHVASEPLSADIPYDEDYSSLIDLWRALDKLSTAHRTVIVLHYFEGLTAREIGSVLGSPDPTIRFRLMAARRRLRNLLQSTISRTTKGTESYVH